MNPDITQIERIGEYRMIPYRGRLKSVGDSPGTMGQEFSVGQLPDCRWETSLLNTGERKPPRKQFVERDLEEAVWFAERHWFPAASGASDVGPKGPTIEKVFAEWLDVHPVKRATVESDHLPRTDLFAKWAKAQGLALVRGLSIVCEGFESLTQVGGEASLDHTESSPAFP